MFGWLGFKTKETGGGNVLAHENLVSRLREGLARTRQGLAGRFAVLFGVGNKIDEDLFVQVEELLVTADLGARTAMELVQRLRQRARRDSITDAVLLRRILQDDIRDLLTLPALTTQAPPAGLPLVVMAVGVNGAGKTTTVGKLAALAAAEGRKVMLVAADTFRAAAINQLKVWGERSKVEVVAQQEGADAAAVVFDALESAVARGYDVVFIDTAGRLHTKVNLMEEMKKLLRVAGRKIAGAPHEVLLVLDATTGQNGLSQARLFHGAAGVTGLVVTKMDGTARGGIAVNIARELAIPIRYIGVGERVEDLHEFDPEDFAAALVG